MPNVVFCDVEGTLLTRSFPQIVFEHGRRLGIFNRWQRTQAAVLSAIARVLPGNLGRTVQTLGIIRATVGCSTEQLDQTMQSALPDVLAALKPEMVARLREHQQNGYELVLISAGLHTGIVQLAQVLGGRGEGSKFVIKNGRYTGQSDGPLCQGAGKAARARTVMTELQADASQCIGYGDTGSDVPFLALMGQPHAVDPAPALAAAAQERGWDIIHMAANPTITTSVAPATAPTTMTADDLDTQAQQVLAQFVTPRRIPLREKDQALVQRGEPLQFSNGLRAIAWGSGPIVLLVHGWEGRGTSMSAFVEPLVAAGMRAVALDGPAHGESAGETTDPYNFALAVLAAGRELGPLAGVIGHSMGGASTAIALQRGLDVQRVVLIASPSSLPGVLIRYASATALPEPVAQRFYQLMEQRVGLTSAQMDVAQISAGFTVPLLVFHDPEDAEVPYTDALEIVNAWPGAELRTVTGRGHRRILIAPEVVTESVAFLVKVVTPTLTT